MSITYHNSFSFDVQIKNDIFYSVCPFFAPARDFVPGKKTEIFSSFNTRNEKPFEKF